MKITAVEPIHLRVPVVEAIPDGTLDVLVIRIETDAGITGWGEAFGYNAIPATLGISGVRSFMGTAAGSIYMDPAGAAIVCPADGTSPFLQ